MGRVIAVYNAAGGVAKTTTTRDLSYELAQRSHSVLAIDADSQGTLSDFFGTGPFERDEAELFWTEVCRRPRTRLDRNGDVLTRDVRTPHIIKTDFGVEVGLSNYLLVEFERSLADQRDTARLLSIFESLRSGYDFILVDCAPSISEITIQTLLAVDEILIPVQTESKAVAGFVNVQREINEANERRRSINRPPLRLAGVVPTLFNANRAAHKHYLEKIREISERRGCPMFPPVHDRIAVMEACNARLPVQRYDPACIVTEDMRQLADQLTSPGRNHAVRTTAGAANAEKV